MYWGSDAGRSFDVIVNGVTVATEALENKNPGKLFDEKYVLPAAALDGQQNITLQFKGRTQGRVGGIFGVRAVLDADSPF